VGGTLVQRITSTLLAVLVSAIVLWWLLKGDISQELIQAFAKASIAPLFLGGLLALLIQILRGWRFAILASSNLAPPSWTMIGIASKLVLFNFLLPFKLGELSFPLLMRRAYGTPIGEGAGILILCRLLDLGVVAAVILSTAAWLLEPLVLGWNPTLIGLFGVTALIASVVLPDCLPRLRHLTTRWPAISRVVGELGSGASRMRPIRQRLPVIALTVAIWISHAVIAWLVVGAIDAGFDFVATAMASASSNLAFALPITGIAGLGPPQAAWATMLHLAGHDWTPAIASALLCHGLLLVTLSAFGLLFWIAETLFASSGGTDSPSIVDK
jgi:uncharacterized membrane protein YbhN (UPF0104 family)